MTEFAPDRRGLPRAPRAMLRVGSERVDPESLPGSRSRERRAGPAGDEWPLALAYRGPVLRVLGGPGTGKTRLAVEIVASRVDAGELAADECLLLAASRRSAATLRDAVTTRLAATTREPLSRTFASLGFGILRRAAIEADLPTPRLLSGPEQDVVLRDLLDGHRADPAGAPPWPDHLSEALTTRGFRAELRDLLMRAVERGVDPQALAALGRREGRPEWVAAAQVLEEYDQVTALSRPGAYDPAWIVTAAADALEDVPGLLSGLCRQTRLIVVDDAQEVTASGARLLGILAGSGVQIVLLGDPDCAVQTFRGAEPGFFGDGWRALGAGETVRLRRGRRMPGVLAAAAGRVVALIGAVGGTRHRGADPVGDGGVVEVHVFRSAAAEAGFVADVLRRAHLVDGMPWSDMAVIVRGQARAATIRRVLASARVPVAPSDGSLPVRDEEAVRPLLTLLRAAVERRLAVIRGALEAGSDRAETSIPPWGSQPAGQGAAMVALGGAGMADRAGVGEAVGEVPGEGRGDDPDAGWSLTPEAAVDLLTSPYGGADAVVLRRLRRALRRVALDSGSALPPDVLLARALARPGLLLDLGPEADGARRIAAMLEAARVRLAQEPRASAETVLWDIWTSARVADAWREAALAGGRGGMRADRDLDAVVEVFAAAAALADRVPGSDVAAFLDHIGAQEVAADTLAARSPEDQCVSVLTPHASAGREWPLVAVAGVQEGTWPDLRLRGSLLGSEHLVEVLAGREPSVPAAQAAIRHDEARLFHVAVSRASHRLIASGVRSEEDQPSAYLDVLDPRPEGSIRAFTEVERPLTLVGTVGSLRRELGRALTLPPGSRSRVDPGDEGPGDEGPGDEGPGDEGVRHADSAARTLAVLAREGVRGADPAGWWALRRPTSSAERIASGTLVPVSPSGLVEFGQCQVRWLLGRLGGEGPPIGSAALGTLVHETLAECGDAEAEVLRSHLAAQWGRLGLGGGWLARAKWAEGVAMVDRAAAYFAAARRDGWVRIGAEVSMRHTLGRAVVSGVADRLERNGSGGVRVIDYKTGSTKPKVAEVARHPQLGCYQVALEAGAFGPALTSAGAALVQLGKASTKDITRAVQDQRPLADDEDPEWARTLVTEAGEAMSGATYAATPGDWCRTCAVRTSCPVQPEGAMLA
jgi:superfamily I DNA/RNA helicase/RecB family exonuclease